MATEVERPAYITNLLNEIDLMDEECFRPTEDVPPGAKSIFKMTSYERKIYALMQATQFDYAQMELEAKFKRGDKSKDDHAWCKTAELLRDKGKLLQIMMWALITERAPHEHGSWSMGIRGDWEVIRFKRDDSPLGPLRALFGGEDD